MKQTEKLLYEQSEQAREAWLSGLLGEEEAPEHAFPENFLEETQRRLVQSTEQSGRSRYLPAIAAGILIAAAVLFVSVRFWGKEPTVPPMNGETGIQIAELATTETETAEPQPVTTAAEEITASDDAEETEKHGAVGGTGSRAQAKLEAINGLKLRWAAMKKDMETKTLEEFIGLYPEMAEHYQEFYDMLHTTNRFLKINPIYLWINPEDPEAEDGNILLFGSCWQDLLPEGSEPEPGWEWMYEPMYDIRFVYYFNEADGSLTLLKTLYVGDDLMRDFTFQVQTAPWYTDMTDPENPRTITIDRETFYSIKNDGTVQKEAEFDLSETYLDTTVHPEKTVYISHEETEEQYLELWKAHGGQYGEIELGELNWEFLE